MKRLLLALPLMLVVVGCAHPRYQDDDYDRGDHRSDRGDEQYDRGDHDRDYDRDDRDDRGHHDVHDKRRHHGRGNENDQGDDDH